MPWSLLRGINSVPDCGSPSTGSSPSSALTRECSSRGVLASPVRAGESVAVRRQAEEEGDRSILLRKGFLPRRPARRHGRGQPYTESTRSTNSTIFILFIKRWQLIQHEPSHSCRKVHLYIYEKRKLKSPEMYLCLLNVRLPVMKPCSYSHSRPCDWPIIIVVSHTCPNLHIFIITSDFYTGRPLSR